MNSVLRDRISASLFGTYIADALSMPVHWYYRPLDIKHQFGFIQNYESPKPFEHPSSIMKLSNVNGAGRGVNKANENIVGNVILHGKAKYWNSDPGTHYHLLLKAGDNTLNSLCCRVLVRSIIRNTKYSKIDFLSDYIQFMTANPDSHNDTYAESFHRLFFKNYNDGKKPEECADDDDHNVASIGGFVMLSPVAFYAAVTTNGNVNYVKDLTLQQMYATHNSDLLGKYAALYAELICNVLMLPPVSDTDTSSNVDEFRKLIAATGKKIGIDVVNLVKKYPNTSDDTKVIGPILGSACYIDNSFAVVLYLAYKYADKPADGLASNTNSGGENCHRGSALGTLLGLRNGMSGWPVAWVDGLTASKEIKKENEQFINLLIKE